jgi:hypothetical protein
MIVVDTQKAIKAMERELKAFSPSDRGSIISQALNRAIATGRTEGRRQVTAKYNIKSSEVTTATRISRATPFKLSATIHIKGQKLPLRRFKPKQTSSGVRVQVTKGQSKVIQSAFLAPIAQGHGVFARGKYGADGFKFRNQASKNRKPFTRSGKRAYPDLPITQLISLSVPSAFTTERGATAMSVRMTDVFEQRLAHEIKRRRS